MYQREDSDMKGDTAMGTVLFENGKYYIEADGERNELPVSLLTQEENLKDLLGQKVEVLYSEPKRFVVGLIPDKQVKRWPRIICYLPAPWEGLIETRVADSMRATLAKQYLEAGIISEEVFGKLG